MNTRKEKILLTIFIISVVLYFLFLIVRFLPFNKIEYYTINFVLPLIMGASLFYFIQDKKAFKKLWLINLIISLWFSFQLAMSGMIEFISSTIGTKLSTENTPSQLGALAELATNVNYDIMAVTFLICFNIFFYISAIKQKKYGQLPWILIPLAIYFALSYVLNSLASSALSGI